MWLISVYFCFCVRVCVCPNEPLFASSRVDESALYVVVYKLAYINSFVTFFYYAVQCFGLVSFH